MEYILAWMLFVALLMLVARIEFMWKRWKRESKRNKNTGGISTGRRD